jgi:hypothetical protein
MVMVFSSGGKLLNAHVLELSKVQMMELAKMLLWFHIYRPPHNDYSSAALQKINDKLYMNIFDEYVTDISQVYISLVI